MADDGLWLLRHGDTVGGEGFRGRTDDALAQRGYQDMQRALAALPPPARVVTSPLRRCATFARDVAARRRLPLVVDDDLRELDFGHWEGCTAAELQQRSPRALAAFWRDPAANPPPGGEGFADFVERVDAAHGRLRVMPGPVLVVSHGGPIRRILLRARGLAESAFFDIAVPRASLHHAPGGRTVCHTDR